MMTAETMNAHSAKYAAPDESCIDLMIEHPELGWIPFTVKEDDPEPLGQDLYIRALDGEFGEIAAYDGLTEAELLADQMREERNQRLIHLDMISSNPLRWAEFTGDQQAAFTVYRQALLDVPQQEGFPHDIDWPEFPSLTED